MSTDEAPPTFEQLLARARSLAEPVAAELADGGNGYDKAAGRWRRRRVLGVVCAEPSRADSRYRAVTLHTFLEDDAQTVRMAESWTRDLAQALGVQAYVPVISDTGAAVPCWIEQQGPSPSRCWAVEWSATHWNDDGIATEEDGIESVEDPSASGAEHVVGARLRQRLRPPYRYRLHVQPLPRPKTEMPSWHIPPYPDSVLDLDTLRAQRLRGDRASTLVADMFARPNAPSICTVMVAWAQAFACPFERTEVIGRWRHGTDSDARLDEVLAMGSPQQEHQWQLPHALRSGHAAGQPPWPLLRASMGHGAIPLALALREAFGFRLPAIKQLIHYLCYAPDPEQVAALFDEAMQQAGD